MMLHFPHSCQDTGNRFKPIKTPKNFAETTDLHVCFIAYTTGNALRNFLILCIISVLNSYISPLSSHSSTHDQIAITIKVSRTFFSWIDHLEQKYCWKKMLSIGTLKKKLKYCRQVQNSIIPAVTVCIVDGNHFIR